MQRKQDSFDPMLPLLEFREVLLKMCVEFGPKASSDVLHRCPSRIKIIHQAIFSETRTFLTNPSHISDQIFTRACEGGEASAPLSRGAAVVVGRQGKVGLRFYLFAMAATPIFHSRQCKLLPMLARNRLLQGDNTKEIVQSMLLDVQVSFGFAFE